MTLWLETVAPVIKAQIETHALEAAVSPAFEAAWSDDRQPFVHPEVQAELLLTVTSMPFVAQEESYEEDGDELIRTIGGHRRLVIQVKCQTNEHLPQYWAQSYLERLRIRLDKQSVNDALAAVNCGIIDYGDITAITGVKVDKRLLNVAIFDLFLSCAFDDTDGSESVDYFDHIDLTGAIVNPSGVAYPSGVNPIDVVIPPGV